MISVYDKTSGRITHHVRKHRETKLSDFDSVTTGYVEGEYAAEAFYVANSVLTLRPTQATLVDKFTLDADGVDVVSFTEVPTTAIFTVDGQRYDVVGPSVSLTFDLAGEHVVEVEAFPYLNKLFRLEAV